MHGMDFQCFIFPADTLSSGIHLVFLPPYSPDYNPIEELFSSVKAYIRRNNVLIRSAFDGGDIETTKMMIEQAVIRAAKIESIQGWYRDSGYC